ncbi:GNAT family N-acetyltransferase [Nocardioides speluncae]|uniref:GNAT family N-acetyltransferase n=1 Tax=Nocardioides speluncae TaxID=2670337 RepID=UPI000D69B0D5|nr:GNAT family N-acetyltransferase [Nocardioides speluncae]
MITFEPLDLEQHLARLHAWVTHPRSVYWMMQGASVADVAEEYTKIANDPHHHAWLGRVDGVPAFLAETYDPALSELAGAAELAPGDLGMHVLVAPTDKPRPGFTGAVFAAVMDFCFKQPGAERVVVEPDVGNDKIRAKNIAAGFVELREVVLTGKTGMLSVCSRSAWESSSLGPGLGRYAAHLTPELMERAQRQLVAKAISEFAHERLLAPVRSGGRAASASNRSAAAAVTRPGRWGRRRDHYELTGPASTYSFSARVHPLEHWVIDLPTLTREVDGRVEPLDALAFVAEFAPQLGIPDQLLPTYLEELASTLSSSAWKLANSTATAAELANADYQTIEGSMTEGHPAFVANNGRIGFGGDDFAAYAPEARQDVRLVWLAVRRDRANLSVGAGMVESELYETELGKEGCDRFADALARLGLDPADYLYLPVHPWQWVNKLAITFAPDLARRDLVFLGSGDDDYRAQQSIRTFFNTSRPERHYVKVALSIQNMGFMRGLSPKYMSVTPPINDWVASIVADDVELKACGFAVLRERAAIGYTGDAFHTWAAAGEGRSTPYQKMIAALWRESPAPALGDGERAATMASLLHRDAEGRSLAGALIRASGLAPAEWVRSYLRAYLRPLVHCLLRYELAFMPHGENLVMVLRDHVPVRMFMKDIGEEVAVMGDLPLPPEVERIRADVPADVRPLAVHTDVFDGFLRYLGAILDEDGVLVGEEFWAEVARCIAEHAEDHTELAATAAAYDLFKPAFKHSCLNRLQLRNTLQMVDLTDQAESLIFAGTLPNPIAPVAG